MLPSSEVVPKPWGYEYCAFDNGKAAVWILHIAKGKQTSLHAHPKKKTRLICLQGEVAVNAPAPQEKLASFRFLKPLEAIDIDKGIFHQSVVMPRESTMHAENGAFLMEIEEPSDKADIVRMDDAYGRTGKPIEAATVPCNVPMLKLSTKPASAMGYTFKIESTLGGDIPDLALPVGGEVLGIYKEKKVRVSDYVASFVKGKGVNKVFGVSGGGGMYLFDSFHDIFVPTHHEQAAAMASDAYARITGLGCTLVTTGPGGTNALTGVACSWVDSVAHLIISGQVTRDTLLGGTGLRQFGVQETDVVALAKPITKDAILVTRPEDIRKAMEYAYWKAIEGRPGPVWVDIPLDIQGAMVEVEKLEGFTRTVGHPDMFHMEQAAELIKTAKRPVLVLGNGVHIARAEELARKAVAKLHIPVVSSWLAADIVPTDDPHYIGRFGIFGDRASNLAVQNADLLIVVGSRLSIPQVGYNFKQFAREAKIVMVDTSLEEMSKPSLRVYQRIHASARDFLPVLCKEKENFQHSVWLGVCRGWKEKYPVVLPGYREEDGYINSFHFVDELSKALPEDAVVVTDMGTAFTCTFQAATMKLGQRWLTASGHAPMGYGLPGAIGAHYATGKKVVCIVGDGSLQFNLQELQTIVHHKLPITVFVINNAGYLAMKHTFKNHFGRQTGADADSGVSFPDTLRLATAYYIPAWRSQTSDDFLKMLPTVLGMDKPYIFEVMMRPDQPLIPRSASLKRPDGSIVSRPIEDLYPFLEREELAREMIVKPAELFQ